MNEIEIFKNDEFGEIRTIEKDGRILFCGKDVAVALGYSNTNDALNKHCKGIVKCDTPTNGGVQKLSFITEGDVYRLIASSKLESAQKFESWVFDEVLPTLRKTGTYTVVQQPQKSDKELELLERQLRIAESNAYKTLGESYDGNSKTFKEVCMTYSFNALAGKDVLELPTTKKSYSAAEVGKQLGISAQKVGKISNKYGLKTEQLGKLVNDKSLYSDKEVETWRYFEEAISLIAEHKDEDFKKSK